MNPIIIGITNQFGMAPGLMKCAASIVRRMISSAHNSHFGMVDLGVQELGRHSIHERYLVPINPHRPDRAVIAAPANYRVPFVFLNNRTQIGSTICANNMLQRGANYLGGNLLLCRPLIKSGRRGEDCGSAVFKTPYQAFGALALTELNRSGYVKYNPPRHDSTRSN